MSKLAVEYDAGVPRLEQGRGEVDLLCRSARSADLLDAEFEVKRIGRLIGLDFHRWYADLKKPATKGEPEHRQRAYKAMQPLHIIVQLDVVAGIEECFRVATVLEDTEFSAPAARLAHLTFAQATTICEHAIAVCRTSIAIAYAWQFEFTLRQIDVIGKWTPAETGASGIIDRGQRWAATFFGTTLGAMAYRAT